MSKAQESEESKAGMCVYCEEEDELQYWDGEWVCAVCIEEFENKRQLEETERADADAYLLDECLFDDDQEDYSHVRDPCDK